MTIAKDFASKFAVALVAIAMILVSFAPAVQAQEDTEDLQKTINDLLAQVAALQGDLGEENSATAGSCSTFTRDLKVSVTGADVKELQMFLNSDPDTRVAAAGAGSAGMETMYFGPATGAAVSKFQVKYRAEILSPAGLVNPTGFFGPSSRAQANKLCAGTPGDTDEDEEDEDDEDMELSGEGQLDVLEIDEASDSDIQEGAEDEAVAELTVEASDGDIKITRLDIMVANTADDQWEIFESFTLWVDGEMVGEVDASDEDEYLDEDDGTLRFSGLEIVAMEDEEIEITIGASVQSNLDTVPDTVDISVEEVRYFDADGVADDDSTTDQIGDSISFDIEEEGEGEELTFSLGANNPEATDIVVDEDDTTDGVTVLEYEIEAEEGDIEINDLWVRLTTGTEDVMDVVDDVMLVIDGEEFDAEATSTSGDTEQDYMFDIDGDVVVEDGETVTIEVVVDFKSTDDGANYANAGETIKASVTSALADLTDAEGADDLEGGDITGSAVGDTHNLVSEGIVVPVDGVSTETDSTGDNNQTGEFTIEFEVSAVEGDFYIVENAGAAVTTGIQFLVETAAGTSTASGVIASTADEDTAGVFTVRDGETETFTLTVTVDTNTTTQARVTLTEVNWSAETDGDGVEDAYVPTPASDFRTGYQNINAN